MKWNKSSGWSFGEKLWVIIQTTSSQRHTSRPPSPFPVAAHWLWVSAAAPKTTDWAIMADALSTLSCCVQTNKSEGDPVEHLRDVEAPALLCLPPAGPQDAAGSRGYASLCVEWRPVMESPLMFNPGQELMQGFCQEAERPLMQRRNVNQRPNLSTNRTCSSSLLVPGVFIVAPFELIFFFYSTINCQLT